MTSDSSSPAPDGPLLPPRHRPSLENIAKDTTELDLWEFDEDIELTQTPSTPDRNSRNRVVGGELPAPRERSTSKQFTPGDKASEGASPKTPKSSKDITRIRMNVIRERQHTKPGIELGGNSDSSNEREFDDLDDWDDVPSALQIEDLPTQITTEVQAKVAPVAEEIIEIEAKSETSELDPAPAINELQPSVETSKTVAPDFLRPKLKLSHIERLGLLILLVLLGIGGVGMLTFSIMNLPTTSGSRPEVDFPVKGNRITVEAVKSYWREPITDGAAPELFRRGTILLPVIDLKVSEGSGAIRLLFRNSEGELEGDAVIRKVNGPGIHVIAGTAGFDDFGMHAAYRAGHRDPWTVEVYEAPSETTPGKDFQKLFVMDLSTERR